LRIEHDSWYEFLLLFANKLEQTSPFWPSWAYVMNPAKD